MNLIKCGDHVVLRDPTTQNVELCRVSSQAHKINNLFKKFSLNVSRLINKPFGSLISFDETGEMLEYSPRSWASIKTEILHYIRSLNEQEKEEVTAQRTLRELIRSLWLTGAIDASKSDASLEKTIQRKLASRILLLEVLPPSLRNIHSIYVRRCFHGSIDLDVIQYALNRADIRHNSLVMCVDQISGVLTTALTERLSAEGRCYHLSQFSGTSTTLYDAAALNEEQRQLRVCVPIALFRAQKERGLSPESILRLSDPTLSDSVDSEFNFDDCGEEGARKKRLKVSSRLAFVKTALQSKFNAVVMALNTRTACMRDFKQTSTDLQEIYRFASSALCGNGHFVVMTQSLHPLIDLYNEICRDSELWCDYSFKEVSNRRFCVDEGRCHPVMNTKIETTAGFVLAATRLNIPDPSF